MKKKAIKALSVIISVSMLVGMTACGKQPNPEETSAIVESSEKETETKEKIKISDFYEYANGEWEQSVAFEEGTDIVFRGDKYIKNANEWVQEALSKNPSDFENDPGMQNMLTFWTQLKNDREKPEESLRLLQEDLKRIEQVKSLEELYELYGDKDFYNSNLLWDMSFQRSEGEWALCVSPSIYPMILDPAHPEKNEVLYKYIVEYSGCSDTESKVKNITAIENKINSFLNNQDGYIHKYDNYKLRDEGMEVPVWDTMVQFKVTDYLKYLWMPTGAVEFYNGLYSAQNLQALKDYLWYVKYVQTTLQLDPKFYEGYMKILAEAMGMGEENLPTWESMETTLYNGVLARSYANTVVGEQGMKRIEELAKDIKTQVWWMLTDTSWLTTYGKELAKKKVNHVTFAIARNGYTEDFDNIEIGENAYESIKAHALVKLAKRQKLMKGELNLPADFDFNLWDYNAYYNKELNSISICAANLGWLADHADAPYEEFLGEMGATIAHEIGHAYDLEGSLYDGYGDYNPWMTDEEYVKYLEILEKIKTFFDGKETKNGYKINGDLVKSETFADLLGVECCLGILAKMDNPDYDLFFRSFADGYAMKQSAEKEKEYVANDPHLPPRERVNYVLAQFDKFYEVYDVEKNSPYYVAKEDRMWELLMSE